MASEDHLLSSSFVKSIHQKLRDDAKILGAPAAWQKHCKNEEDLRKYAFAMQNLATVHWDENCKKDSKAVSRVEWIYQFSKNYFIEEEISKYRLKEEEIARKMDLEINKNHFHQYGNDALRVLDVGSCYNPLKIFSCFDVIPIDIAPANSDVYKCDFLNLKLTSRTSCEMKSTEITELQEQSFDVVVFSLLLEYLPSSKQRQLCCEKAYDLLKVEGILIVITPDSKHVGANAKIMKSWRFVVAKLGFSRIKYEKLPYLHCMVFRKTLHKKIAQRWALLQDPTQFFQEIVIPQDFNQVTEADAENSSDEQGNKISCDVDLFEQLPNFL